MKGHFYRQVFDCVRVFVAAFLVAFTTQAAFGQSSAFGDLDGDGEPTVMDIVRIVQHLQGTAFIEEATIPFADVDRDGVVDTADIQALTDVILERRPFEILPFTQASAFSPANGETDVAVTRETIVRFSLPLADSAIITTDNFYATFAGRKILSRVELSSDRLKATLFYLEPLPDSARIRVRFDGNGIRDYLGREIDIDGDGEVGGTAVVDFDTLSITPVANTAIIGNVYASKKDNDGNNVPLQGVVIEVVGDEENTRTTTGADGSFVLEPVPAGRFFVNVDGRPVTGLFPTGDYYPFVGKAWDALAGRSDNLASGTGEVFLPLVCAGTLQAVSATEETEIGFPSDVLEESPELAGVSLNVPANSLFSDDGTRGGSLGIAPVEPDRIPEPLPPGLELPLVITIQTDGGTNFDRPVPVRFPNTPDPETGNPLAPGDKRELFSFNHDTGEWERSGPMTVTEDGRFVDSDIGVGVRQPGWHGQGPIPERLPGPLLSNNPNYGPTENPPLPESCGPGSDVANVVDGCIGRVRFDYEEEMRFVEQRFESQLIENYGFENSEEAIRTGGMVLGWFNPLDPAGFAAEEVAKAAGAAGPTATVIAALMSAADQAVRFYFAEEQFDYAKQIAFERYQKGLVDCIVLGETLCENQSRINEVTSRSEKRILPRAEVSIKQFSSQSDITAVVDAISEIKGKLYFEYETGALNDASIENAISDYKDLEALFGDDPIALINDYIRNSEVALIDRIGNAPEYGINYMVQFQLPDNSITKLRGITDSFGRFDLLRPDNARIQFVAYYDQRTNSIGYTRPLASRHPSFPFDFPRLELFELTGQLYSDRDDDSLVDEAENVLGTDPNNPDSDDDGIPDGAEIEQGTNPLDGRPVTTGVIASAPVEGEATTICALNDLAIVGSGTSGVTMFNVAGINPVRIAQIDTPGTVNALACANDLIAVADGSSGLTVIDVSDPPAAFISHQIELGSAAHSITVAGLLAVVGLANGDILTVDLETSEILHRNSEVSEFIYDLSFAKETLLALTDGELHSFELQFGELRLVSSLPIPGGLGAGRRPLRLSVGSEYAYATNTRGFNVVSISDPTNLTLIQTNSTNQFGWKQIRPNGSGTAIAAVSPNSTNDGPHHIDLIDLGEERTSNNFITTLITPGLAAAVDLYNGITYVADSNSGLQVVNYLAFDTQGQPPTLEIETTFPDFLAEEGKLQRITARVDDDVQVRNVRFFINDELVSIDGNYPFEYRFNAPSILPDRVDFSVRVVATDTGGNTAEIDSFAVELVPDATPPRVARTLPASGGITGELLVVSVVFDEPIDFETVDADSIFLTSAGPDGRLNTTDDLLVPGATYSYRDEIQSVVMEFPSVLDGNLYELTIQAPVADLAGNDMFEPLSVLFHAFDFADTDRDGIPDDLEGLFGFDPNNSDSNRNGIPDGSEDEDSDGLINAVEVLAGLDPFDEDSNGNGILDGDEDVDGDGMNFSEEFTVGTDPFNADTDDDGWVDSAEIEVGANPLVAASTPEMDIVNGSAFRMLRQPPPFAVASQQVSLIQLPGLRDGFGIRVLARPALSIFRNPDLSEASRGVHVATPVVNIFKGPQSGSDFLVLGQPQVQVLRGSESAPSASSSLPE